MVNRSDCYSLVWEQPAEVHIAVRKSLRFYDAKIENIPIEISSEAFSLETQKTTYLNPCHDAHVILQTLMRTARNYRSVIVLNKGEPCVRWINRGTSFASSIDLVIDASDVATHLAQERVYSMNRWTLLLNVFVFGMVALMFVQLVRSNNSEMRLTDYF